jgi:predicted ATPase
LIVLTSVHLTHYKSFTYATVQLAPLTVLIGANGSGKSNFLDALRFCQFLVIQRTARLRKFDAELDQSFALELTGDAVSLRVDQKIVGEGFGSKLNTGGEKLFDAMQTFELDPKQLRNYASKSGPQEIDAEGEGFARLVHAICANPIHKQAYLDWLAELRPDQITDVDAKEGANNDLLFRLQERGGAWMAAPSLSDGSLRFAALAALLFQEKIPSLICIEEIENGMHPARLNLVVQLLRALVQRGSQVIVTTHAPWLLAWLDESEREAVQLFYRDDAGTSQVKSLRDHQPAMQALKSGRIDDLFAEGFLEATL